MKRYEIKYVDPLEPSIDCMVVGLFPDKQSARAFFKNRGCQVLKIKELILWAA